MWPWTRGGKEENSKTLSRPVTLRSLQSHCTVCPIKKINKPLQQFTDILHTNWCGLLIETFKYTGKGRLWNKELENRFREITKGKNTTKGSCNAYLRVCLIHHILPSFKKPMVNSIQLWDWELKTNLDIITNSTELITKHDTTSTKILPKRMLLQASQSAKSLSRWGRKNIWQLCYTLPLSLMVGIID